MITTIIAVAAVLLVAALGLAHLKQGKRIDTLEARTVGALNFITGIVQSEANRNVDRAERLAKLAEEVGYIKNPVDQKAQAARVSAAQQIANEQEDGV